MKKTIVVYFSNTGNNRYLAERIAHGLNADIEAIRPRLNLFPLLLLSSALKTSPGIRALKHQLKDYDSVVLCGPIWMGMLVAPLRDFIRKHKDAIKTFYFATCCGSSDSQKDDKFGHAKVFSIIWELAGDKRVHCEAFPIVLVVPGDKTGDGNAIMKTRLSDGNFKGEILQRFDSFIKTVSSGASGASE